MSYVMSKDRNVVEKKLLLQKKKHCFKNIFDTPFIGDEYDHKVLYITNKNKGFDEVELKQEIGRYPSINRCSSFLQKNNKKIQLKNLDVKKISFYNFNYDWKKHPIQGSKGKELENYLEMLCFVIECLKPEKIVFWGKDVETKIKRIKRPKAFGEKTFEEFLQDHEIRLLNNVDEPGERNDTRHLAQSELQEFRNVISGISELFNNNFKGNRKSLDRLNEVYEINGIDEIDKISIGSRVFSKGLELDSSDTTTFWLFLRRAAKILNDRCLPVKENAEDLMMGYLMDEFLFIEYRLVPNLLEYFKMHLESQNQTLYGTINNGLSLDSDSINKHLKNSPCNGTGVQTILKSMYQRFKVCTDQYLANSMKMRIFVKKGDLTDEDKELWCEDKYKKRLDSKEIIPWTRRPIKYIKD